MADTYTTAGLFAGIGGVEVGLEQAGHRCVALVEKDEPAREILARHFVDAEIMEDVRMLDALPGADIITAGFPCADLSQAGRTNGIDGEQSGLVKNLFQLLRSNQRRPEWILMENVPFMLCLQKGRAMRYLMDELEELGYRWAYRVVNSQAFGLPQRRRRVFMVASQSGDPRRVLLADDAALPEPPRHPMAYGFYWTEGNRGLGWGVEAIPPLKGSSGLSIPAPPAIWLPGDGTFGSPDIRDAERLQGFPVGWTAASGEEVRIGHRWRLIGNAVSVPVAAWIGNRLAQPAAYDHADDEEMRRDAPLPNAAWGEARRRYKARVSEWPVESEYPRLKRFLQHPPTPLSDRAATGFLRRARASRIRFQEGFLSALDDYVAHIGGNGRSTATNA